MNATELRAILEAWKQEGERLAGKLTDLDRRATVYHHLFRASGGNHIFPLIAAHGALWAGPYFRFGMRLGKLLVWQHAFDPELRQQRLAQLAAFADAFRDINRRVCIDTYATYHFTALHGDEAAAAEVVSPDLLEVLLRVHAARRAGKPLTDAKKREVFLAHFLDEQAHVVGPRIAAAVEAFTWPVLKAVALKPIIKFAYFPTATRLWFRDFSSREERIANGLVAFDTGERVGWRQVEAALDAYHVLPTACVADEKYFEKVRQEWLTAV